MIQQDVLDVMPIKQPMSRPKFHAELFPGKIVTNKVNVHLYNSLGGMLRRLGKNRQVTKIKVGLKTEFIRHW